MDYLATSPQFNTLSLRDLLRARDQFHTHLMHKANVIGTAVGRYLVRQTDPYPTRNDREPRKVRGPKPPRTLETSEVRDYSWPAVLVFVHRWIDDKEFNTEGQFSPTDYIPKMIYLDDGRVVPICVVEAPLVETAPPPLDPADLEFAPDQLAGGYPVITKVQGAQHIASLGCLLTDGHAVYALTSRHVAGEPDEVLFSISGGKEVTVGRTSKKSLGRLPFEKLYESWPGKNIYVNMDVGLIEVEDQTKWNPSVYGLGQLGPLADLSVYNITLNLIGCPVRAYGCASGRLSGRIAALFYRYKSIGGLEYVADFLIGSASNEPLQTRPGDSGTVWAVVSDDVDRDLSPIAVQWGGTVFAGESSQYPFALATNLSNVCRELEVDLFRSRELAAFEYWGAVGHYAIGAFACEQVSNAKLRTLMMANRKRISFEPSAIDTTVNDLKVPKFIPLADVPDKVWKKTKTDQTPYGRKGFENPNHYADMDYRPNGGQSLDDLTPNAAALKTDTWKTYYKAIGWNAVSQRGLVPFRVWQIYKKMVEFVTNKDVEGFVAAAGVLAHYVGDCSQPLHSSYLDDGDPFRDKQGNPSAVMLDHGTGFANGVHVSYEDDMVDAKFDKIISGLPGQLGAIHGMQLIQGGQQAGYAAVELARRCRNGIHPIQVVEAYGALVLAGKKSEAPAKLWAKFGTKTIKVMADGCKTLAMLWDSAWAEGNGDLIPNTQLKLISTTKLRALYERQDFLPSKPLGQIDPFIPLP